MSNVIDRKVVEMEFDNSRFEKNVGTSISTIDKLKESLNFDGLTKGFDAIDKRTSKMDFSGLSGAIEGITYKFSAFEAIAFGALTRIGERAIDAGIKLAKSMSVDNIASGWSKFEEKTRSVGTLIAQGFDTSTVNSQLDRLNWYTDETSYSFTNMVAEIAKFTASGKGLEESVDAMIGIANWAAVSGQNASTASRAMYQLSQAMGSGLMRKEDYKSIQNVSMDTAEFRQRALDAGVALGTLKKNADGTYRSLVAGAKSSDFNISQFADHLTQDMWFTSDVMMEVFRDYGNAVDAIYKYAEENQITASEAIEALSGDLDEFGLKAFRAAQEARSWGDTVESVKEAVASGFMKTFEIVFGEYDDAVDLWTDLANRLYDVFAEPLNEFNYVLEEGLKHSTPYVEKFLTETFGVGEDLLGMLGNLVKAKEDAEIEGFSVIDNDFQSIIKSAAHGDEELSKLITDYVRMYKLVSDSEITTGATTDALISKTKELTGATEDEIKSLKTLGDKYGYTSDQYKNKLIEVFGKGKKSTYELVTGLLAVSNGLDLVQPRDLNKYLTDIYGLTSEETAKLHELANEYGANSEEVDKYIGSLKGLKTAGFGDKKAAKEAIKNLLELNNGVGKLSYTWRKGDIVSYISALTGASSDSVSILKKLTDTEKELANTKEELANAEKLDTDAIERNAEAIEENRKDIEKWADEIANGDEVLKEEILTLLHFEDSLSELSGYRNLLEAFNNVWEYIANILGVVKEAFDEVFPPLTAEKIYEFTERLKKATENLQLSEEAAEKLKSVFKGIFSVFRLIGQAVKPVIKPIKAFFDELFGNGEGLLNSAANIGDWITALADSGKVAEVSEKIFSKLSEIVRVVVKDFKELFNIQEAISIYNEAGGGFNGVLAVIKEKLKDVANGILNFISAITGWDPTAFKEKVKTVFEEVKKFFKKIFGKDENYDSEAGSVLDRISEKTGKASEIFEKLKKGIKTFIEGVKNFFKKLGGAFKDFDISTFLEKLANVLRTVWHIITTVASKLGEVLGTAFEKIGEAFKNLKSEDILTFMDKLAKLIGTILAGFVGLEFTSDLQGISEIGVGFVKNFAYAFEGIADVLDAAAKKIQIDAVKSIATSLLMIAAALVVLAMIPVGKLYAATGVIALVVEILVSAMKQLSTVTEKGWGGIQKGVAAKQTSKAFVKLAIAVLLIAFAMRQLKDIDTQHIILGTAAITAIMYAMVGVVKILSNGKLNGKGVTKAATGLVIMAIALRLIIWSVKAIAKLLEEDPKRALQAMIAVGAILLVMTGIALLLSTTKHSGRVAGKAMGLIILAFALRLIIWSVNAVVKTLSGNPSTALQAMIAVGAILVVLSGIALLLSTTKHSGRVFSKAVGLIVLALALRLIIWSINAVVETLSGNPSRALQAMIAVGAILVVMSGIAMLLSSTGHSGRIFSKAVGLIVLALALRLIIWSVNKLVEIIGSNPGTALQALIAAGAILVVLSGIAVVFSKVGGGGSMLAGAMAVVLLASALGIMALVLNYIAKMSWGDLLKGIGAFAVILGILVGFAYAIKPVALALLAGAAALFVFGVGLIAVGAGLMLFGLGLDTLFGAITAFSGAFAASADLIILGIKTILSAIISLIPFLAVKVGEGIIAILDVIAASADSVAGCIVALVEAALVALKELIPEIVDSALEMVTSILQSLVDNIPQLVDLLFEFVIGLIDGLAKNMPALIQSVVNLVAAIISGLVDAINQLNLGSPEEILDAALKLGEILLILNGFALLVPGALLGIAGLGLLAAEIVGLLAIFAEINDTAGTIEYLARGIDLLEAVGSAIGRFVGAIVGGVAESISNSLPKIGKNLATFMKNAEPFFDKASSLDPGVADGVIHLAAAILVLTATEFVNGIMDFLGIGVDWASMGDKFAQLGTAIKNFSESTEGINADSFMAVSEAMGPLVDLATGLPNTEGLWGWISGKQDIGEFGQKLGDLASGMAIFAREAAKIPADAQQAMMSCAQALGPVVDMSHNLPNTEGAWGWISGKQDIGEFGQKLGDLASGMAIFAEASANIPEDAQQAMINCANALVPVVDMSNNLPNTEGAWGWISGKQDIAEFGQKLGDLASGMTVFAEAASKIPEDAQASMMACATALGPIVELSQNLPNTEGAWGWISGKQDLAEFGEKLGDLADGISIFAGKASAVTASDAAAITALIPAVGSLVQIANALPNSEGAWGWLSGKQDLGDFADNLSDFGDGVAKLASKVSGITSTQVSNISSITQTAKDLASISTWSIDGGKLKTFGSNLEPFGTSIATFASSCGNSGHARGVTTAVSNISKIVDMVKDLPGGGVLSSFTSGLKTAASEGVSGFINAFNGSHSKVTTSVNTFMQYAKNAVGSSGHKSTVKTYGANFIQSFIDGMESKKSAVYSSAYRIGQKAVQGLNDGIKSGSPSKETTKSGEYFGEGFVNGVRSFNTVVEETGRETGEAALEGLSDALKGSDYGLDSFDNTVTIKPVMDLSEIQNGVAKADGMLGGLNGYAIDGSLKMGRAALDSMGGTTRSGYEKDFDKLTKTIEKLGDKLDRPNQTNNFNFNGMTNDQIVREVKKSLTSDIIKEGRKWA